MRTSIKLSIACAVLAAAPTAAGAAIVLPTAAVQLIGTTVAGQAYSVTATGTVSLCATCNGGGELRFNPDGTVATPALGVYAPLNSGPKDYDPAGGITAYGRYGPGVFLGALYGSFTVTPTSASDLFLIGYGTTIAAGGARNVYAVINDTTYSDNVFSLTSQYDVRLDRVDAAVPEPATWAMVLLGFGGLGHALRRRRTTGARIRFA